MEAWPGTQPYPLNSQWVDNALFHEVRIRVDQATTANDVALRDLACPPMFELASSFLGTGPHTEACAYFDASPVCAARPAGRCNGCPP